MANTIKFARKLNTISGISEENKEKDYSTNEKIKEVLDESIAKTCLNILVSLSNQDLQIKSKNKRTEKRLNQLNKDLKIIRTLDSIFYNQLSYGSCVFAYQMINKPIIRVYDSSTFELILDPRIKNIDDKEFEGIYQDTTYTKIDKKTGSKTYEPYQKFIPSDSLILVPGIGKGTGESLIEQAYPYVKAKKELVGSLYNLVKRLGLLTVILVDLPGDVGDDDVDEYLDEISGMIEAGNANSTYIFPTGTVVEGVRGSGEARVIESVKTIIDMLDEEIRKCLFVPDTFLSSLSANRATAKEQRYLIATMVKHIRELVEEALRPMYVEYCIANNLKQDFDMVWGNINLPDPEELFKTMKDLVPTGIITEDDIRAYLNLGAITKRNIYQQMGYNNQTTNPQFNNPQKDEGDKK